jgi:hypothetical protein
MPTASGAGRPRDRTGLAHHLRGPRVCGGAAGGTAFPPALELLLAIFMVVAVALAVYTLSMTVHRAGRTARGCRRCVVPAGPAASRSRLTLYPMAMPCRS